jgi:hypothetical protein
MASPRKSVRRMPTQSQKIRKNGLIKIAITPCGNFVNKSPHFDQSYGKSPRFDQSCGIPGNKVPAVTIFHTAYFRAVVILPQLEDAASARKASSRHCLHTYGCAEWLGWATNGETSSGSAHAIRRTRSEQRMSKTRKTPDAGNSDVPE